MNLEEIQAVWSEMSDQLENQKKLTNELIMQMTQQRYTNKFKKLNTYETIGAVLCYTMAIGILFNFGKLDTWYLILCGLFTLVFMLLLPIAVLRSLSKISKFDLGKHSYKEAILHYSKEKNKLLVLQQFGMYGGIAVFFTSMPVASKILSNKDFFLIEKGIGFYIFTALFLVFLLFFMRWGYSCYKKITTSAENILKELA